MYDTPFVSVTGPFTHGEAEAAALDEYDVVVIWLIDEAELLIVGVVIEEDDELRVLDGVVVVTTLLPPGIKLPGTELTIRITPICALSDCVKLSVGKFLR